MMQHISKPPCAVLMFVFVAYGRSWELSHGSFHAVEYLQLRFLVEMSWGLE
jgi:hypothetical protein